jgi:hypothetical protein
VPRLVLSTGALLMLLGVFWAGRESTHGLNAFAEHWWCPTPLAMIAVGLATALTGLRLRPAN